MTPSDHDTSPSPNQTIRLEFPVGDKTHDFIIQLDLNEYSQQTMWRHFTNMQLYEPETSAMLCQLLQPGDSFIDAGGHIGYFSLLAASIVGKDGNVFTFEPESSNRDHIIQNVLLNQYTNVHVSEYALGEKEADLTFYINSDNDGGHAFWDISRHNYNEKSRQHMETRIIHQTGMDLYFRNTDLGSLRLIKMDIEGSEYNALLGAEETLQKYHYPCMILEINRFALEQMGHSEELIRNFMKQRGYETYFMLPDGLQKLDEGQYANPDYVFNLLFSQPGRLNHQGM